MFPDNTNAVNGIGNNNAAIKTNEIKCLRFNLRNSFLINLSNPFTSCDFFEIIF